MRASTGWDPFRKMLTSVGLDLDRTSGRHEGNPDGIPATVPVGLETSGKSFVLLVRPVTRVKRHSAALRAEEVKWSREKEEF